ncbi:MAG: DUF6270 domain-containing protein [Propionibacteriaceae bacterium]|nr:DUF6270 domain-containing protein [Propionibacteriaceae bacterium]
MSSLCGRATPLNILIFGSCVSRDPLAIAPESCLHLVEYIARSSLISAFAAEPWPHSEEDLQAISSPFRRRMVQWDLGNTELRRQIEEHTFDILLMDLVDERFAVQETSPGVYVTLSNEFVEAKIELSGGPALAPWTEERFALWTSAWSEFVSVLGQSQQLHRLRINEVYWSSEFSDGTYAPSGGVSHINACLQDMYDHMRHDIPEEQFYRFTTDELKLDKNHQWGIASYHFGRPYWDALLAKLYHETI